MNGTHNKNRAIWLALLPYFYGHWGDFLAAALSMSLVALLSCLSLGLIKPIFDQLFIEKDKGMLMDIVWMVPIIFFAKSLFSYLLNYLMTKIGHAISRTIRNELVETILTEDHSFHAENPSADLLSRATNDILTVGNMVMNAPLYLLRDGLTVIFLLGLIFYLNARFAAYMCLSIPIFAFLFSVLTGRLRRVTRKAQELVAGIYGLIAEGISGLSVIKIYLYESQWLRRFEDKNEQHYKAMLKYQKLTALSPALMEFVGGIVITVVFCWGGLEAIRGVWTTGDFLAFLGASFGAYQPIKRLAQINSIIQMGLASWQRILIIKERPGSPLASSRPDTNPKPSFTSEILFDNVRFRYPDGRPALEDINLCIKKGEILGVAGPSGSGKSTMAMLTARFYDPSEGKIILDGQNIRDLPLRGLRRLISFVTQEAFLFDDTVRANIALSKPEAKNDEIESALKAAHAWDFLQKLPQGIETRAGERGVFFSAGQRQRLAIARAILKNASLLILDEATSNLDPESEELVFQALANLLEGKTAIVISHRPQTLSNTDRIVLMERGRILEETTYRSLNERPTRLAELLRII